LLRLDGGEDHALEPAPSIGYAPHQSQGEQPAVTDLFAFGFAADWMRKDLGICRDEAAGNGAELPVTEIVDSFYARIQEHGGGRWDTSSLIGLLVKP